MYFNIGIDIEQVSRFKKRDNRLFEKIFSKKELKKMKNYNAQHLAGIFSAKEAIIKACNPIEKLKLKEIEVFNRKEGHPHAIIKSKAIRARDLKISISHSKDYAVAFAILSIK